MSTKVDTVKFTSKGQIVIPNWIRKNFGIEEGTKAIVSISSEGVLLRPITKKKIASLQGILREHSISQ